MGLRAWLDERYQVENQQQYHVFIDWAYELHKQTQYSKNAESILRFCIVLRS